MNEGNPNSLQWDDRRIQNMPSMNALSRLRRPGSYAEMQQRERFVREAILPKSISVSPEAVSMGAAKMLKEKKKTRGWRFARSVWSKGWTERKMELRSQDATEGRTGLRLLLGLARHMIKVAAKTEPNMNIRRTKRRDLQDKWRKWQSDLLRITRS